MWCIIEYGSTLSKTKSGTIGLLLHCLPCLWPISVYSCSAKLVVTCYYRLDPQCTYVESLVCNQQQTVQCCHVSAGLYGLTNESDQAAISMFA